MEFPDEPREAFICQQGWASVSLDGERGLMKLRLLYEHLQVRILEMKIFRKVEQDEQVIARIVTEQWTELEPEIAVLNAGARAREEEIEELVESSPF